LTAALTGHVRHRGPKSAEEVAAMIGQRVRDVMTPEVVVVAPDCGFKHIVDVLNDFKVSAVPVVENGTVVGIVSEADLLHKIGFSDGARPPRHFERHSLRVGRAKAAGETARAVMSSPVITIDPDASLATAARLMEQHQVKRLPVVDDGRLVGIVARRDLLRRFLRPDAEITQEIREDVLRRRMWTDPAEVQLSVTDGHVTLRGCLDRRSTTVMAVRLVGAVDGVVGVSDEMAWRLDDLEAPGPAHLPVT
jgi:CBS domain-containing protein